MIVFRSRLWLIFVTTIFLFQNFAIQSCVQIFTSISVGDQTLMYYDMSIEWFSSTHLAWAFGYALPMLVLYSVVIPLGALYHMFRFFGDGIQEDEDEEGLRLWGQLINMYREVGPC